MVKNILVMILMFSKIAQGGLKFKKRSGMLGMGKLWYQLKSCEEFVKDFSDYVKAHGFIHQQMFICDKISLFWKRVAWRTHHPRGESITRNNPMFDWLLCYVEMQVGTDYSFTTQRIKGFKKQYDKK